MQALTAGQSTQPNFKYFLTPVTTSSWQDLFSDHRTSYRSLTPKVRPWSGPVEAPSTRSSGSMKALLSYESDAVPALLIAVVPAFQQPNSRACQQHECTEMFKQSVTARSVPNEERCSPRPTGLSLMARSVHNRKLPWLMATRLLQSRTLTLICNCAPLLHNRKAVLYHCALPEGDCRVDFLH